MMLLTLYHDSILLYFNKNILSFVFSTGYFGDIFRINSTQNNLLGIVRESWKEGKGKEEVGWGERKSLLQILFCNGFQISMVLLK